jgi:SET domain-containing protein
MKKLYVKNSTIEGKGIHALEDIKKHEHIAFLQGSLKHKSSTSKKDALSIPLWYGVTKTKWIDPEDSIWRFFNHSCNPNTAIVGTKKVIALKNIKKGAELTFDYSMTDGDVLWEMPCRCGTNKCRTKIQSIQKIPERSFKAHMPFIPKYFINLRKRYQQSVTIK